MSPNRLCNVTISMKSFEARDRLRACVGESNMSVSEFCRRAIMKEVERQMNHQHKEKNDASV